MSRAVNVSPAQARFLARVWSAHKPYVSVMTRGRDGAEPYNDATKAACVKRGWFAPADDMQVMNGYEFRRYVLTDAGVDALEDFLRLRRYERAKP